MQTSQRYFTELDATLKRVFREQFHDEQGFGLMLRYAMGWVNEDDTPYHKPGGKRLRPLFLLLCAEASGGNWTSALPAAASVELLHNFSLIHDDIQDSSDIRHGRATVWRVWGVANAINAGDAMFTLAYRALELLDISPALLIKILRIFNITNVELTRGQHLDMRFEKQHSVSLEEYISMIKGKSAALLATSAQLGALIGCGDEEIANFYSEFGLNLGIAFQIHDDILGIWGDASVTGKSTATDIVSRKKSLPILFGLEKSVELATLYQKDVFSEDDVNYIVGLLNTIGAKEYAIEQEKAYYDRAMLVLEKTSPSIEAKDGLMTFVDFLFDRNY